MGCGNSKAVTTNQRYIALDSRFNDMQTASPKIKIGSGVKCIYNYICTLPFDALDDLRMQFWTVQTASNDIWKIIQKCCEEKDESKVDELIKKNEIVLLDNKLSYFYLKKQPNNVYHVPNFCLCEPIFVRDYSKYEQLYDVESDNNIRCKIFYHNDKTKHDMKIRNKATGFDFKYKIMKMLNINKMKYKMRLIYKGFEIEDVHCVYYHGINNQWWVFAITTKRNPKEDAYMEYADYRNKPTTVETDSNENEKANCTC